MNEWPGQREGVFQQGNTTDCRVAAVHRPHEAELSTDEITPSNFVPRSHVTQERWSFFGSQCTGVSSGEIDFAIYFRNKSHKTFLLCDLSSVCHIHTSSWSALFMHLLLSANAMFCLHNTPETGWMKTVQLKICCHERQFRKRIARPTQAIRVETCQENLTNNMQAVLCSKET